MDANPSLALGDLAAGYLTRGQRFGSSYDLVLALDAAARAVEHDSTNAAAQFNLALSMTELGLVDGARHAWARYLREDSTSGWANEARVRIRELAIAPAPSSLSDTSATAVARFVDASHQAAREAGLHALTDGWASAVTKGDARSAARSFLLAKRIADRLRQLGVDQTLSDAVSSVRTRAGSAHETRALARADLRLAASERLFREGEYRAAADSAAAACDPSLALTPALRIMARTTGAAFLVYLGRLPEAARVARALRDSVDARRYPTLAGRLSWTLSTIAMRRGAYDDALAAAHDAEALYRRAGELENAGGLEANEMQIEYALGDAPRAYDELHRALVTLRRFRGSVWLHTVLQFAAIEAARDGLPRAALRLADEDVAAASRTGRPIDRAEALLSRAPLRGHDPDGSARDVASALPLVAGIRESELRGWLTAERQVIVTPARVATAADGTAPLDSAIAFFSAPPIPAWLIPALAARADARESTNDLRGARADLFRLASVADASRQAVSDVESRASLLGSVRHAVERLVQLDLDAGRDTQALAEWQRDRAVLNPLSARMAAPQRSANPSADAASPARGTTLTYALLGDSVVAWVSRDGKLQARVLPVRGDSLTRRITRVDAALDVSATSAAVLADLTALDRDLLRPIESLIAGAGELTLVIDDQLADIPFAALRDAATGRFLIERHALRFSLDARDALADARGPVAATAGRRTVLIGDPAFDAAAHPELARLPGADAEVAAIAHDYANAEVIAGAEADLAHVRRALSTASVFHFAGHAVVNPERPERSALMLAGANGELTASSIATLPLHGVRLVVLSGCETARAGSSGAIGFGGLAGAFLAAGAGGVVGSTHRVDDDATQRLMASFHRAYTRSGDAARALQAAQLELLRSKDPTRAGPEAWAEFRYVEP